MQVARASYVLSVCVCLLVSSASLSADELKVSGSVVKLPPLLVESSTGQPWLFCRTGEFNILSRCSTETTQKLVQSFARANQALEILLPQRLRFRTQAPQLVLLYDAQLWPKARQDAVAQMLLARAPVPPNFQATSIQASTTFNIPKAASRSEKARRTTVSDRALQVDSHGIAVGHIDKSESVEVEGYVSQHSLDSDESYGFFSNLRLTDADIMVTFAVVDGQAVQNEHSALTYEAVSQLLTARVPKLPSWFIAGFLSLYSHVRHEPDMVVAPRMNSSAVSTLEGSMLPLRELLISDQSATQNPGLWLAQSELLVRWGLDPQENRRDKFWRFVEQTVEGKKPTETLFAEYFGRDLASATKDLNRYLAIAKRSNIVWGRSPGVAPVEIREASRSEVARIRGEWERLEVRYVRKNRPDDEGVYMRTARRTIQGAYDRGDRDPELVATLGLLLLDAGDNEEARHYLEEAVFSSVARPRAYFELAKIRYERALDYSRRNDGRIEPSELVGIVDVLAAGMKMAPPLLGNYELLADIWANTTATPDTAQLELIEQGLSLFPTEPELFHRAAILYKKMENFARADELAVCAMRYARVRKASEIAELRRQLVESRR